MADISDVFSALSSSIASAVYPTGTSNPPVAGNTVSIFPGWPLPADLDQMATDYNAAPSNPRSLISLYAPSGGWRNTTRYPLGLWTPRAPPNVTLTATVSGTSVTIGGAVSVPQNAALVVKTTSATKTYVYAVLAGDTLNSVAAGLTALVNADTPATSSGATVTIPAANTITARVGASATALEEVMRQTERVHVDFWCPSPTLRDQVSAPVKAALAGMNFLTLADQTAARIITCGDGLVDDPQKAGIYRRTLIYDIEYGTTVTMTAYQIVAPEEQVEGASTALGTGTQTNLYG